MARPGKFVEAHPDEPAAVPSPKTMERFSADTLRAKAARMMPNEPAAIPRPISTPPIRPQQIARKMPMRL